MAREKKNILITVILFILFVITPNKYYYIPIIIYSFTLLHYNINILKFLNKHKYLLIIGLFNLFYLIIFYIDRKFFDNQIDVYNQLIIIFYFSLRTIFTILLFSFYTKINTFNETIKGLLLFKIKEKYILFLIMLVRFFNIFSEEIQNLVRNYKIKVNGRRFYILRHLLQNFIIRVYSRTERYAIYFTLKNFNNGEDYIIPD